MALSTQLLEHFVKRLLFAAGVIACGIGSAYATDVGVSIAVSQPGVYGRIDIGRFPAPSVVVAQPVMVAPAAVRVEPVYMWVPPGHRNNWAKHCHRYGACGVPVYFVADDWYDRHVVHARYADAEGGGPPDRGPGHGKGNGKGKRHGD